MAYKSLIDYYGGGMVKPSDGGGAVKSAAGYQLGGMLSAFGIKSGAESERRTLKEQMEKDARGRGKGAGASFVGGLIGTGLGTLFGAPQVGAAIGSGLGQSWAEEQYKPVDVSGGKYALDIKKDITKGQQEYKGGGLERIGMAGLMGYMGGGEGGMYQSILGAPKKLAEKAVIPAAAGTVAPTAAGAVLPTSAGTSAMVAPTSAGMTFPSSIGPEPTLFDSGLTGSGTGETLAQGLQDWALPESPIANEAASDLYGPLSSLINPAVTEQGTSLASGWGTTVTGGGSPVGYAYGSQPYQTQMAGGFGTMAYQAASSVAITGGAISGITDKSDNV